VTLEGSKARHPFLDRTATVHTAEFVTLETGSGCVHIAPGHGDDDDQLGRRWASNFFARRLITGNSPRKCGRGHARRGRTSSEGKRGGHRDPDWKGSLLGRQDYVHSYPHCWRSKTPILFRAGEQFFIRIDALRETALSETRCHDLDPALGRNRIRGHGRVSSRLVHLAPAHLEFLFPLFDDPQGEPILDPAVIAKVAEVVAAQGSMPCSRSTTPNGAA